MHITPVLPPLAPEPANAVPVEHLSLVADAIANLAWIADREGWIFWYNQRWYAYTGATPAQMEGWGWQSVHDPATLPSVMERWSASIATGQPFEMVFPLKGADGIFRSFLTTVMPFKDENGSVLRWFGTNTDISREVEVANALRESEQRFRVATEATSDLLWTNDATGKMRGEQPGWCGFTGQTEAECQGYGWSAAIHPDDVAPTIAAWEKAVGQGSRFLVEHRVRRHDGIYRLCSVRALPVRNPDRSVREWVGVHTDTTEERQAQQVLQNTLHSLEQQQELVEAAQLAGNVGFWRFQPRTAETWLSSGSRHLLGIPLDREGSFNDFLAAIHPDDRPALESTIDQALVTGHYAVEYRTAAGRPEESRWLLALARIFTPAHGDPYFVGINLDITQQKRAHDALMRSEKLAVAGRLAASIAHEINNPLEAVTNLVYLLLQAPLDAQSREYALTLSAEIERISNIATHTLRFHRQSTRSSQAPAAELLNSVVTLHEGRLRNSGIAIDRRFRATEAASGFAGELRQVLANLVGNAIDAMSTVAPPRYLRLRTRNATHWPTGRRGLLITIADTGTGMTATTQNRLFEAFFTTKGETGTGLGLWVSLEIVAKHRGSLRLRSCTTLPQRGTVFQLFLPSATLM